MKKLIIAIIVITGLMYSAINAIPDDLKMGTGFNLRTGDSSGNVTWQGAQTTWQGGIVTW